MMLGWCMIGDHQNCRRKIQRFVVVPATRKKKAGIQYLDEYLVCECTKRGCKCHVPAKERTKPNKRKKK